MKVIKLILTGLASFIVIIFFCYVAFEGVYFLKTFGNRQAASTNIDPAEKEDWQLKVNDAVARREVILGMTQRDVLLALGYPSDDQKNVGSWGTFETWTYSPASRYKTILFQNGILTSWQE